MFFIPQCQVVRVGDRVDGCPCPVWGLGDSSLLHAGKGEIPGVLLLSWLSSCPSSSRTCARTHTLPSSVSLPLTKRVAFLPDEPPLLQHVHSNQNHLLYSRSDHFLPGNHRETFWGFPKRTMTAHLDLAHHLHSCVLCRAQPAPRRLFIKLG